MDWQQLMIPNGEGDIFCNAWIMDPSAMNIIVTHTPVCSTLDMQQAYRPLTKYPVNVFAFDFSGTGKSGGKKSDFSRCSIVDDLNAVANYIQTRCSSDIHLYGSTGIGGIFAQHCACSTDKIKSFAQFACVDYMNTKEIGFPLFAAKTLSWCFKRLPNFHITVKPPKYNGYNSAQDNDFYVMLTEREPKAFHSSTKVLNTMLECFIASDSAVKNSVAVPTLVFKTLHDRYFSQEYFDSYFSGLTCKKRLVEIDNTHNSYYFSSDAFCDAAYAWFSENR